MAYQGLFTQGTSVDDLLEKRRVRSQDLQQQLMQQAAQGARNPVRAQGASMIGSVLGRALAGNLGGQDEQMDKLKAREAESSNVQGKFMEAVRSNDSEAQFKMAEMLQANYPKEALQMLQIGQTSKIAEDAKDTSTNKAVALQGRSATVGEDLSDWNPELSFRLVSGTATQKEYDEGLKELTAMNKELNGNGSNSAVKGYTFNTGGTYVDPKGHRYILTNTIKKSDGTNTMTYTPVGNAPAYVDASLAPVNSSGMSQAQRIAEKLAEVKGENEAKKFYNHQEKAGVSIGQTTTNLTDARRMGELLETVNTGGQAVLIGKAVSDFFGTTPTNVSELDTISKTMMLSSLKSLLGGQLSDGERKAALEVQVALEKGKGANKAIVDRYITIFESKLEREQNVLSAGSTGASYRQFLLEQSVRLTAPKVTPTVQTAPTGTTAPSKTIKWVK